MNMPKCKLCGGEVKIIAKYPGAMLDILKDKRGVCSCGMEYSIKELLKMQKDDK